MKLCRSLVIVLFAAACDGGDRPSSQFARTAAAPKPGAPTEIPASGETREPPEPIVSTVSAAPLVESDVAAISVEPAAASRREVEPVDERPRLAAFEVRAFIDSLTRVRSTMSDEERRRFDLSLGRILSGSTQGSGRDDARGPGPLGALLESVEQLKGLEVEAVIALAASKDDPFDRPRTNTNESAAIATLKNIASAQAQFQASVAVDVDGDGAGEYGTFAELAGGADLRGRGVDHKISPAVLSAAFQHVHDGVVSRSGYAFQIWLPSAAFGQFVSETQHPQASSMIDAEAAERSWRCYAWPIERGVSGRRAFFVDQSGDVRGSDNERAGWSGVQHGPKAHAAMQITSLTDAAVGVIGQDGDVWVVVN